MPSIEARNALLGFAFSLINRRAVHTNDEKLEPAKLRMLNEQLLQSVNSCWPAPSNQAEQ